ncbi:MAG TPA: lytic transglycosylase domain-containing protein [Candidatus Dormibacteraeota bacterium]|nr:lytic transglycosylase domain-containing protein [Candidatus Dormibacteraeota bacterium]
MAALLILDFCLRHWKLVIGLLILTFAMQECRSLVLEAMPAAPVSAEARADIPGAALRDYQDAAATCPGLSWALLAAIGKVESDHGRSTAPGVHWGANYAGAEGPMQFEPGTWATYGQGGNVYDHRDASFAAARLLCANGAGTPSGVATAVWTYNHDWGYVASVQSQAARYAAAA